MQDRTVTEEIRELLDEGNSSTEVIALGYRPGTVYKAQRRLRSDRADAKLAQGSRNETQDTVLAFAQSLARTRQLEEEIDLLTQHLEANERERDEMARQHDEEIAEAVRQLEDLEQQANSYRESITVWKRRYTEEQRRSEESERKAASYRAEVQRFQQTDHTLTRHGPSTHARNH